MANSIKFFIFSMIGYIAFTIVSIFFPFMSFVSLGFGGLSGVSLIVYLFKKINTRHHFLLLGISFAISLVFLGMMNYISEIIGISKHNDIITVQVTKLVYKYGTVYSLFFMLCSLIILGFDFLLSWIIKLSKERNNYQFKLFRFSVYCSFFLAAFSASMSNIVEFQAILQGILFITYILNIISVYILVFKQTDTFPRVCFFVANFLNTLITIVLCRYVMYSGDAVNEISSKYINIKGTIAENFLNTDNIGLTLISKIIFMLYIITLLIQMLVYMIEEIFLPKKSVIRCFMPVVYAAIGLFISGIMYYYGKSISFYFPIMSIPFYISMMSFTVGIAISFTTAAYKVIFAKNKNIEVEKINIDLDE